MSTFQQLKLAAIGAVPAPLQRMLIPNSDTAGALGQDCIVTHVDGSRTSWKCVNVSPYAWLPTTPGIIKNITSGNYERTFIQDGTIQTELLPNALPA